MSQKLKQEQGHGQIYELNWTGQSLETEKDNS